MNKKYIPGVIVVEGNHDASKVSLLYDTCFVITNGYEIPEEEKDFLSHLKNDVRVIALTDNDKAGEEIRNRLNSIRENMINIRITAPENSKKKGVAECDVKDIEDALNKFVTIKDNFIDIDLYEIGLLGKENSKQAKEWLCKKLHLGKCSRDNLVKRINLLGIKIDDLKKEIANAFSR